MRPHHCHLAGLRFRDRRSQSRELAGRTMGHVGGSTAQKGTKLEATGELGSVLRTRAEPHRGDFHENRAAF